MNSFARKAAFSAAALCTAFGIASASSVPVSLSGNSGSGSVWIAVSASVTPFLTMDIGTGTVSLWALSSGGYKTQTFGIEIGTNANAWATVSATSANGGLQGTSNSSNHLLKTGDSTLPGESYQIGSDVSGAVAADLKSGSVRSGLALAEIANASPKTVYSVSGPERHNGSITDAVVTVRAKSDDLTPTDTYSDTLTFTVSANF